jgi:hypothetical protein
MITRKLTDAEKAFLSDLNELMRRHGVSLSGSDQYDGADNFAGTEYTFEKWEPHAERATVYLELRAVEDMLP